MSSSSIKPALIIISTHNKDGRDIVKGILEKECVGEGDEVREGVVCWDWHVDNKYYTATVQLAVVTQPEECASWILEHGEACLIYCDQTQNDVVERINSVVEKLGQFEPEVELLVCDSLSDDDNTPLSRLKGQQWCISNGWELVELHPNQSQEDTQDDDDDDDDFPDSWGFKRISQALHASTWSNLIMKDKPGSILSGVVQSISLSDSQETSTTTTTTTQGSEEIMYTQLNDLSLEQDNTGTQGQNIDSVLDPSMVECMGGDETDFENLFSSFEHLKKTAASLPPTQRRDYAEKVAVAFWRAMGGDDEEVNGLDALDSD